MISTKPIEKFLKHPEKHPLGDKQAMANYAKTGPKTLERLKKSQRFEMGNPADWDYEQIDGFEPKSPISLPFETVCMFFNDHGKRVCVLVYEEGGASRMDMFSFVEGFAYLLGIMWFRDDGVEFDCFLKRPREPLPIHVIEALKKMNTLENMRTVDLHLEKEILGENRDYTLQQVLAYKVASAAATALICMNEGATIEKSGYTQQRKMQADRKKGGCIYKTLRIDLDAAKRIESKGGTHASPRYHLRRGHWRHYQDGKKIWIGPMEVGDKENGEVIKDYEVKAPKYFQRIVAKLKSYTAVIKEAF